MSGILAMKQYQPSDKVTALFDQALETHFTKMKVIAQVDTDRRCHCSLLFFDEHVSI